MVENSAVLALPRVLIIDGSRTVREGIRKRIRKRFDVRMESDGEAGWAALLVDPSIQAVIADVSLPKLDGYALLQRVRTSNIARINKIRVIMMAGEGSGAASAIAKSLGATDFITKEIGNAELTARLEALINPSRVPRELTETGAFLARHAPSDAGYGSVRPDVLKPPSPLTEQESQTSRFDSLRRVLENLQSECPGVEATALISEDGLMMASALSQDLHETRFGATASLLKLGTRATTELRRGDVKEIIVRGEHGYAVVISAGRGDLLLVLASESTPLGRIFFHMSEAIKAVKSCR